jgi:hypothetical protein
VTTLVFSFAAEVVLMAHLRVTALGPAGGARRIALRPQGLYYLISR